MSGITRTHRVWELVPYGMQAKLIVPDFSGKYILVTKLQLEALKRDPVAANIFLNAYVAVTPPGARSGLPLKTFLPLPPEGSPWRELMFQLETSKEVLAAITLSLSPKADFGDEARERAVRIFASGSTDNFYNLCAVALKPTVYKIKTNDWLDFIDFILNGELTETFPEFNRRHAGRVFPVAPIGPLANSVHRGHDLNLKNRDVNRIAHRYIQLTNRSRKLKKKFEKHSLQKLIQALHFEIPGTLLVDDTLELFDSLKHVAKRPSLGVHYNSYDKKHLSVYLGFTLAKRVERAGLQKEMCKFLGWDGKVVITDLQSSYHQSSFVAHMLLKLGPELTVKTLKAIDEETDGVSQRGFMELVRRKGFTGTEPPAWAAILLADK